MLILILEMNGLLDLRRKKEKKIVTSHEIKYYHQCGIHLKKVKPFSFRFNPPNKPVIFELTQTVTLQLLTVSSNCLMPKFKVKS